MTKGIVERVVDRLDADAQPRGRVAVDLDQGCLQAGILLVAGDVEGSAPAASCSSAISFGDPLPPARTTLASCSVYWYWVRDRRLSIWMSWTDCM